MSSTQENDTKEYVLDNDEEAERLARNHECIKYFMDGKLIKAPLDLKKNGLKTLDSGTSDGTWIFDARSEFPADATFVGADISTDRLPKSPPAGVEFRIQDINKPWPQELNNSFDLVHQRLVLAGSGANAQPAVRSLCGLVKPGGWIQLVEADNETAEDDGPAHKHFVSLLIEIFRSFGVEKPFVKEMAGWLRENGFENVGEWVVPYTIGKKMDEPRLKEQGVESSCTAIRGLVGYAKMIPGGAQSMSAGELDSLEDRWRAEMYERGGYYPLRVIWGQKPSG